MRVMMHPDDERRALQARVKSLEASLQQAQRAEQAARQRAELLEQSLRQTWRSSLPRLREDERR